MNSYRVYLDSANSVVIQAAAIDTGNSRLWLYDEQEHLVGCFAWENIMGFAVEGNAEGQVLHPRHPRNNTVNATNA